LIEARRRAATARDLVREDVDPVEQRRADVAARTRAANAWLEFKRKE
jgi:hypothetical protein